MVVVVVKFQNFMNVKVIFELERLVEVEYEIIKLYNLISLYKCQQSLLFSNRIFHVLIQKSKYLEYLRTAYYEGQIVEFDLLV